MSITTFDTLKFVRRLEAAGMPSSQAEVQAEVLTEAFNVNLDSLVTKDFLAAEFAGQKACVETRFAEQKAYMDTRFAEQQAYIDTRFAEQQAIMDTRFAEQQATIDTRFAEQQAIMESRFAEQRAYMDERFAAQDARIDANHRVFVWTQAIIMAAVVLPHLQGLIAL